MPDFRITSLWITAPGPLGQSVGCAWQDDAGRPQKVEVLLTAAGDLDATVLLDVPVGVAAALEAHWRQYQQRLAATMPGPGREAERVNDGHVLEKGR